MNYTLHRGNCLTVLRTMDDNSVDSIVTDPPYGLKFMGKKWDYDVPAVEVWAECLRVLKPGGYLLAFAGTRTQHRMAARIEDAGFEIRDMIAWVYSSGFPKSHNLDNHRGEKTCGCKSTPECDVRPMPGADVSQAQLAGEECRKVLQPGVPEQVSPATGRAQLPASEVRPGQSSMEGWGDTSQAQGQLRAGPLHAGAYMGGADGEIGRLCDGASAGDGAVVRIPADADGGCTSHGPRPSSQLQDEPGALAGQPQPQTLGAWSVCGGCGLPVVPRGLGTALKPALEPITVARKPLVGTVAENVLTHGTGALNIHGCRIPSEPVAVMKSTGGRKFEQSHTQPDRSNKQVGWNESGRWPANLIHDGSEEVRNAFPDSNGQQGDLKETGRPRPSSGRFGDMAAPHAHAARIDSDTSAARFFYCAKASRAERNEGIGGSDAPAVGTGATMREREEADWQARNGNFHPTVKPIALMAYLIRLVTPPRGTTLDCYMGSGSTGVAAMREGFNFIGIERDEDENGNPLGYMDIARARIEYELHKPKQNQLDLEATCE